MAKRVAGFVYGFIIATAIAIYCVATEGEAHYFD